MNLINKIFSSIILLVFTVSCSVNGQSQLDPKTFLNTISDANVQLVDVRTPEEFSQGRIKNAINFNYNGSEFEKQISTLDKSKPVAVYCKAGGRSGQAAQMLLKQGFKTVYDLKGGVLAWELANYQLETANKTMIAEPKSDLLDKAKYDTLIASKKVVLIDFYATWCGPCKMQKPVLEKLNKEIDTNFVKIVRIDVDQEKEITKIMKITELPVLIFYQNGISQETLYGFIPENLLKERIEKYLK